MFMVTLEKRNLRRVVAVALVGAAVCGLWFARQYYKNNAQGGASSIVQVTTTEDIQTYFTGYGITIDQATLSADKVQVPTTWDDSFVAFNEVVAQSGYDLSAVKGEAIEKWVAEIPAQSTGEETQYGVILLQDSNIVGAYLLQKPSGEVTGVDDAVAAMAELRAGVGADTGSALEGDGSAALEGDDSTEASADVAAENSATPEITVSLEVELEPNEDGYPVE